MYDQSMRAESGSVRVTRPLAEQALARIAGAPLVAGNALRLLRDSTEHYPAWLAAIAGARSWIHFENYIFRDDAVGKEFAEALGARARAGVRVRVMYDWMGGSSRRLHRSMEQAGASVRCFNPPRLDSPFGWLSRDHRKMLGVDGEVGFVSGVCVSAKWQGDPGRGIDPWRDTGVEVRGPAVAEIERAFAGSWDAAGAPLPDDEVAREPETAAGSVALRVVATTPATGALFGLDQVVASLARRRLWLTDAYFVGVSTYVNALRAASRDGVDVRLLLPGSSDVPVVRPLSMAGYRSLLEAGIRVFEWNGSMLHAKTAVADGRWARVGSTNLNLTSWIGNYELDVAVEDEEFGRRMEEMYEQDLESSTEIVLRGSRRLQAVGERPRRRVRGGSAGRMAAGAMRIGNVVEAAITDRRFLAPAEARMMGVAGVVLLTLATIAAAWPPLVALPLALLAAWIGASLLLGAARLRRRRSAARPEPRDVLQEKAIDVPDQGGRDAL
jgi:cardiolipin synthase